jgi:hypothetical protein
MVEMNNLNFPQLIEAVLVWTGWGRSIAPSRDDARLANQFGGEVAAQLLSLIKSLEEDFYSSDARLVAANLQEMEKLASEQFKRKHPTVADEIVKAFAWCYTFDFK